MIDLVGVAASWFAAGAGLAAGILAVGLAAGLGFVLLSTAVLCAFDFLTEARARLRGRTG